MLEGLLELLLDDVFA